MSEQRKLCLYTVPFYCSLIFLNSKNFENLFLFKYFFLLKFHSFSYCDILYHHLHFFRRYVFNNFNQLCRNE